MISLEIESPAGAAATGPAELLRELAEYNPWR